MRGLTVNTFAQKIGYPNAQNSEFRQYLEFLKQTGAVQIQQSGFSAHSLAHPKIIVSGKDLTELNPFRKKEALDSTQTLYCCPFCGRILNIFENLQKGWVAFGSMLKVLVECNFCVGKFELYIVNKNAIRELRKVIHIKRLTRRG